MGSPENYYGVFGLTRGLTSTDQATTTNTSTATGDSGWGMVDTTAPGTANWTASSGTLINSVNSSNSVYARTSTTNSAQQWSGFGLLGGANAIPTPGVGQTLTIIGLQVRLTKTWMASACAGTTMKADVSWNGGTNWGSQIASPNLTTPVGSAATSTLPSSGGTTSTTAWGPATPHTWVRNDFSDTNFRVRLTVIKGCTTLPQTNLDMLEARVYWSWTTTTTTTTTATTTLTDKNLQGPGTACPGVASCYQADGSALNPRGFWATQNTEGAANVNGDAFQTYYDTVGGATNPAYDADAYYNYAVEMPAGTSNGAVYVYDPVFCAVQTDKGTGDRWFSGAGDPVSTFYELYDTKGTQYDMTDDGAPIANSNGLFRSVAASDTTMGGSSGSECKHTTSTIGTYGDGRDYHDEWYLLASGLSGGANGKVYRLHATSTDPTNVADQRGTDGENSYALYASASGGTPKIYGIGAMQMFTPLSASGSATTSEFYLAQIDAVHAGKTVEIALWDPGDTKPLSASIEIEVPTTSGWSPASLDYTAAKGTTNANAANCDSLSGTGVTSIQTNVGQHRRDLQRLLADHPGQHPDHLHRSAERLVEDQVHDERHRYLQRRHDLEGPDPRQPGPPRRSVRLSVGGVFRPPSLSAEPFGSSDGSAAFR